jgi:hypothetical protein
MGEMAQLETAMIQDEIDEHERHLQGLRAAQAACRHQWGEPYQDVDIKKEP